MTIKKFIQCFLLLTLTNEIYAQHQYYQLVQTTSYINEIILVKKEGNRRAARQGTGDFFTSLANVLQDLAWDISDNRERDAKKIFKSISSNLADNVPFYFEYYRVTDMSTGNILDQNINAIGPGSDLTDALSESMLRPSLRVSPKPLTEKTGYFVSWKKDGDKIHISKISSDYSATFKKANRLAKAKNVERAKINVSSNMQLSSSPTEFWSSAAKKYADQITQLNINKTILRWNNEISIAETNFKKTLSKYIKQQKEKSSANRTLGILQLSLQLASIGVNQYQSDQKVTQRNKLKKGINTLNSKIGTIENSMKQLSKEMRRQVKEINSLNQTQESIFKYYNIPYGSEPTVNEDWIELNTQLN